MPEEGHVSMCTVDECIYNREMECHAPGVQVATHADHADCETFTPR